MISAKLGLGAAQWGLRYGISNRSGQTSPKEVAAILDAARAHGVGVIDTASLYGSSEEVLGQVGTQGLAVVTKTTYPIDGNSLGAEIRASVAQSLQRLKAPAVHGVLLHSVASLGAQQLKECSNVLQGLRSAGVVEKIGVSVYDAEQIDKVLGVFTPDIVQLPLNVFDQRLTRSGHLACLKSSGVEIHARSAFLQGLLLLAPEEVPAHLGAALPLLRRWRQALEKAGVSAMEAALAFVKSQQEIDVVLVGVESRRQFLECAQLFERARGIAAEDFSCADENLVNPALWNRS